MGATDFIIPLIIVCISILTVILAFGIIQRAIKGFRDRAGFIQDAIDELKKRQRGE